MTSAPTNGHCPGTAREAAHYYWQRGYIPVPIPPRSKRCLLDDWPNLRPAEQDLDRLFRPGAELNVGLLLGAPSGGLVDVDLDAAEAVAAAPYLLPATGRVSGRAGKPNSHYWYHVTNPPAKASDKLFDLDRTCLIELRSTGGQTVVFPSLHSDTGERIVWHSFEEPTTVTLGTLKEAVRAVAAAAMLARHWPAKGARHDARLALAGGLLRAGNSQDFAERFLTAVCVAAANEDVEDCGKVVRDTAEKLDEKKKVHGWPTLKTLLGADGGAVLSKAGEWLNNPEAAGAKAKAPILPPAPYCRFPVEALPSPIREFVIQAAAALGTDPAYLALTALAVAASLIGNARTIRLKRTWAEPCVLWCAIIGDSGTLKSPAISAVLAALYRLQRDLMRRFKAEREDFQKKKADYDARKKEAKQKDVKFTEDSPEEPTLMRVVVGDTTIEKLVGLLQTNEKGLLVARDELGAWVNSFTRYKGKAGGSDLPAWLEMFRAGTVQHDRKTGEPTSIFVQHAAVSICGGIQPGALARALSPEFMDIGLGARILMAMPPKKEKAWTEAEIDPATQEAYETLLVKLCELSLYKDANGDPEPFALRLTPEAKTAWVEFYRCWAKVQVSVEGELAAAYSKIEGYAARLALIHHVVSHAADLTDSDPVEVESVAAGVVLAKWFAYEVRRIYTTLSETEDQKHIRKLVELLRSWGGVATARRLLKANGGRYKTAEDAEAALQQLVDAELAVWEDRPPGPKGGRPTRVCVLNPEKTKPKTDITPGDDSLDDDDLGDGVPARSPDTTPPANGNSPENEGSVGFGFCPAEKSTRGFTVRATGTTPNQTAVVSEVVSGGASGNSSAQPASATVPTAAEDRAPKTDTTPAEAPASGLRQVGDNIYLVNGADGVGLALTAVDESVSVGVDCETTGLNAGTDRVRLIQLATDRGTFIVDCFRVETAALTPLFESLAERPVVFHNAAFDLPFLRVLGFTPGPIRDTMIVSQLLDGTRRPKGFHTLAAVAERELGRPMDKAAQRSDWSGALTAEQLAYAAADAEVLRPLHDALEAKADAAKLKATSDIESRCVPALAWLSSSGVGFDRNAWDALASEAKTEADALARQLDEAAPQRPGRLISADAWNWSSPDQVREAFAAAGVALESTDDDALAAVSHPLADLLRKHRAACKRISTYGPKWYAGALHGGRVYAGWRQMGADSGRMACAKPNLQNIPRNGPYRRCFIASPGRVLVKADYSQIELRIAAKITGDKPMTDAYARGADLHTETARRVMGAKAPTKADRQTAKSLNFGLLYGMRAKGFRRYALSTYGVEMTEAEAVRYRDAFFEAYPGLAVWHRRVERVNAAETRTLTGRRRLMTPQRKEGGKWTGTPHTERLNTPVQGTGADGLKHALALLWERRTDCPGAFPVLVVHDEIVVEADADKADAAAEWLKTAMIDGMAPLIAPVPVEVEVTVAATWGGEL